MDNKDNKKLLTVSVAAYNAEDYLREVLDSFIDSDKMDLLEIIVVDDGATDSSYDIAMEYQNKYPGVFKAVHKANGGWGSTVNYSMRHATGKYFRLLDGDDFYHRENLDLFLDYLADSKADLVISPYATFKDGSNKILDIISADEYYQEGKRYKLSKIRKYMPLAMHSFTVKTAILQDNNVTLKEGCVYRDMEYTANILTYAESVSFFKLPVYFYRLGREGQSVSRQSYLKHIDEHEDIVYRILEISDLPENAEKKKLLYDLARGACTQHYHIYFYDGNEKDAGEKARAFNLNIKKYPKFYKSMKFPSHMELLRKTDFKGYDSVMALIGLKRKIIKSKNS